MVAIRKRKNKAYILLEGLVALATLVTICSLIVSAVDAGRRRQAASLHQEELFDLAQMAVQTRQERLSLNGLEVLVRRDSDSLLVFQEGREVLRVEKD